MSRFTVYKRDDKGTIKLSYTGDVLQRGDDWVCLEAFFGHDDVDIGVVIFRKGDRMLEWFYADRYYNIFQIEDVNDKRLKGWYCNITRPAEITADSVAADDLALDVFIAPDGTITVLDENEFAALDLSDDEQAQAMAAVAALKARVMRRDPPFDRIEDE